MGDLGRGCLAPSLSHHPSQDSPEHGCRLPRVLLGWSGGACGQEGIGARLLPVKGLVLSDAPFLHAVLKHRHDQLQGWGWREDREVTLGLARREGQLPGLQREERGLPGQGEAEKGHWKEKGTLILSENMHMICKSARKSLSWFEPRWLDTSPLRSVPCTPSLLVHFHHLRGRLHSLEALVISQSHHWGSCLCPGCFLCRPHCLNHPSSLLLKPSLIPPPTRFLICSSIFLSSQHRASTPCARSLAAVWVRGTPGG